MSARYVTVRGDMLTPGVLDRLVSLYVAAWQAPPFSITQEGEQLVAR